MKDRTIEVEDINKAVISFIFQVFFNVLISVGTTILMVNVLNK